MYYLETSEARFSFETNITNTISVSIRHLREVFSLEDSFILTEDGEKILIHTDKEFSMSEREIVVLGLTKEGDIFSATFSADEKENSIVEQEEYSLVRTSFELIEKMVQLSKTTIDSLVLIFVEDFETFFNESSEERQGLEDFLDQNTALIICEDES